MLHLDTLMWEFPKIGDPNIVPLNSRILTIRTPPNKVPPIFGNPHVEAQSRGLPTSASRASYLNPTASILKSVVKT